MKQTNSKTKESPITFWFVISVSHSLLGVFLFGYNTAFLNVPEETIRNNASQSYIEEFQWEIVNAMYPVGALFGAGFSGKLSDRIGRKKMILLTALINIIASFVIATSFYYSQLIIGRLLTGVSTGCASVVCTAYINEISPQNLRGTFGSLLQLSITIGIVVSELFGKIYSTNPVWRYGSLVCAILSVIQLSLCFTILESPKWLQNNNKSDEAIRILNKLRGYKCNTNNAYDMDEIQLIEMDDNDSNNPDDSDTSFDESFSGYNRIIFIALFLNILQQFSGINVIFFYSEEILKFAGFNNVWMGSLLLSIANFISTLIIIPFIDKWGRKPLLLLSSIGMTISSIAITISLIISSSFGMITSMILYVIFFEFGLGPIPFLYIAEISPIKHRGLILSLGLVSNNLCGIAIAISSTSLLKTLDVYGFVPFGIICCVGSIVIFIKFPETKNKTFQQIIKEFDKKYQQFMILNQIEPDKF